MDAERIDALALWQRDDQPRAIRDVEGFVQSPLSSRPWAHSAANRLRYRSPGHGHGEGSGIRQLRGSSIPATRPLSSCRDRDAYLTPHRQFVLHIQKVCWNKV